jgi:hypothetical protein
MTAQDIEKDDFTFFTLLAMFDETEIHGSV